MLPERLAFALSLLLVIGLIYLGLIHHWDVEVVIVAALAGILLAMVFGRIAGRLSGRELAKIVQDDRTPEEQAKAAQPAPKTPVVSR